MSDEEKHERRAARRLSRRNFLRGTASVAVAVTVGATSESTMDTLQQFGYDQLAVKKALDKTLEAYKNAALKKYDIPMIIETYRDNVDRILDSPEIISALDRRADVLIPTGVETAIAGTAGHVLTRKLVNLLPATKAQNIPDAIHQAREKALAKSVGFLMGIACAVKAGKNLWGFNEALQLHDYEWKAHQKALEETIQTYKSGTPQFPPALITKIIETYLGNIKQIADNPDHLTARKRRDAGALLATSAVAGVATARFLKAEQSKDEESSKRSI